MKVVKNWTIIRQGSTLSNFQTLLDVGSYPELIVTELGALLNNVFFSLEFGSAFCIVQVSYVGQPIVLPNSLGIVASDVQFPDARIHLSTRLLVAVDPKCIHDQVTVGLLRFHGRRSIGSEPPHSPRPLGTSCVPHPDVIRLIYRSQSACTHRCGPRICRLS